MNYETFQALHYQFLVKHVPRATRQQTLETPRGIWFRKQKFPIPKGGKVLDICGAFGYYGAYYRLVRGYEFEYTILDHNPHWRRLAPIYLDKMGAGDVTFIQEDIHHIMDLEEQYDQILMIGTPHTISSYSDFYRQLHRLLRGGFLIQYHGDVTERSRLT